MVGDVFPSPTAISASSNLQPAKLHERFSVIFGSKNEVERVTGYHSAL
jgi:fructose-1,6-bisphosphatase